MNRMEKRADTESGKDDSSPQSSLSSPPQISLPKGGGAIRGMGEKFAANPVTGTGSMSVPIATSPGRSGLGPQLSKAHEHNRTDESRSAQRYLKRIRYGNRIPYFPELKADAAWPEPPDTSTPDGNDLHGEGIPGILTEQAGAWYYKRNLSPLADKSQFAPIETVTLKPNLALNAGAEFMDLAGKGGFELEFKFR
ncbi:SpvB/TcaC N-terminal domain-containing protein [Nitrosomonas sp.]|uniref:SpvB/TcaC N-terminal domain-containing protein n=1 Tax=Nitrosomonas sp. TaxID=42353 RepID=UPI0037C6A5F1